MPQGVVGKVSVSSARLISHRERTYAQLNTKLIIFMCVTIMLPKFVRVLPSNTFAAFVQWLMNVCAHTHTLALTPPFLSLWQHSSHSWLHSWHHNAAIAVRTRWQAFGTFLTAVRERGKGQRLPATLGDMSFTLICQNLIKPHVQVLFFWGKL